MALVTGVVNFNSKTSLTGADLDTSFFALISQLGGVGFDTNSGVYTTVGGGLTAANLGSLKLPNSMKAEPFAVTPIAFFAADNTTGDKLMWGGVGTQCTAVAMTFAYSSLSSAGASVTGSIQLRVWNGTAGVTFQLPGNLQQGVPARFLLNTPLNRGDILQVDTTGITVSAGVARNIVCTLWCKAPHVRT